MVPDADTQSYVHSSKQRHICRIGWHWQIQRGFFHAFWHINDLSTSPMLLTISCLPF